MGATGTQVTPAETMFCWSVYTQNTGSTKKSYEKELLEEQLRKKVSIFACNAYAVYSDAQVSLGGGLSTIKVEDKEGDFHFASGRRLARGSTRECSNRSGKPFAMLALTKS